MTIVDIASLSLGRELANGGQGSVYELLTNPLQVFKRYHNPDHPEFTPQTLQHLVEERESLSYAGRSVDEFAAWPHAVVVDGAKTVGFLMRRVPAEFSLRIGHKTRLADLSYLATSPKPIWGHVDLPNQNERMQILRQLAGAIDALHRRRIVLGDVSFANILWSCVPQPRIMLLDCDGMRPEGETPVLPQADTIDWHDPHAPSDVPPDRDRDRYKLALAVLRVLSTRLDAKPGDGEQLLDVDLPMRERCIALLAKAAGPVGTRPSAAEWFRALSGRLSQPTLHASNRRQVDAPPAKPDLLASPRTPRQYRPITPPGE